MVADGLTKALSVVKHEDFVGMTGVEDQKELLASIKREEDLRDAFQRFGADLSKEFGFRTDASWYVQGCSVKV